MTVLELERDPVELEVLLAVVPVSKGEVLVELVVYLDLDEFVTGIIEPEIETNVPVVVTVNVSVADVRVTADSELVEVRLVDLFTGTDTVADKDDTAEPVVVEDTTVVLPETDDSVPGVEVVVVVRGISNELLELELDVPGVSSETEVSDTDIEKELDGPGTPPVEVEVREV